MEMTIGAVINRAASDEALPAVRFASGTEVTSRTVVHSPDPSEPIYPGKIWITDGPPKDEFMPFQLSEIYPSLPATIQLIQQLGERRTGISDIQLGNMQNLPGRTPATTMLSLLQEGTRRPDLTLKDVFKVSFERPRTLRLKRDPKFLEIEDAIWQLIEEESEHTPSSHKRGCEGM